MTVLHMTPLGAAAYAHQAHLGQKDKQGRDYFMHHLVPVAMELAPLGADAEIAGYLHDIVEDTKVTLDDLRRDGAREIVVEAIDAVSRREGETYHDLITRACEHRLGCRVKLADNKVNILNVVGLAKIDAEEADRLLRSRYLPARDRLVVAANHWEYLP